MDVERVVVRLISDAVPFQRGLDRASAHLQGFVQKAGAYGSAVAAPLMIAARAANYLSGVLYQGGRTAITSAAQYEQMAIAIEVMTGSAREAGNLLERINRLAVETPFKSNELVIASKQLQAFGFSVNQTMPLLGRLGDVASGVNVGSLDQTMRRVILAFGQIHVAGRLMGPELRQLTDLGVPIFEYLSRVMDVPRDSIKAMVQEGRVSYGDVAKAFNLMTNEGELFGNMMERQSQTVAGRWSATVETVQLIMRDIGLAFSKGFGLADALNMAVTTLDALKSRVGVFKEVGEVARRMFNDVLSVIRIVAVWAEANQKLIFSFIRMSAIIGAIVAAFVSLRIAAVVVTGVLYLLLAAAHAALTPVGILATAITTLFIGIYKESGSVDAVFEMMSKMMQQLRIEVEKVVIPVRDFIRENQDLFATLFKITSIMSITVAGWRALHGVMMALMVVTIILGSGFIALFRAVSMVGGAFLIFQTFPKFFEGILEAVTGMEISMKSLGEFAKRLIGTMLVFGFVIGAVKIAMMAHSAVMSAYILILASYKAALVGIAIVKASLVALTYAGWLPEIVAVTAITVALLELTGAFDAVAEGLEGFFSRMGTLSDDLLGIFNQVFEGANLAMKAGDMKLAGEIIFKGLEVAFKRVIASIKEEWLRLTDWFRMRGEGASDIEDELAKSMIGIRGMWDQLQAPFEILPGGIEGVKQASNKALADMRGELKALRDISRIAREQRADALKARIDAARAPYEASLRELENLLQKAGGLGKPSVEDGMLQLMGRMAGGAEDVINRSLMGTGSQSARIVASALTSPGGTLGVFGFGDVQNRLAKMRLGGEFKPGGQEQIVSASLVHIATAMDQLVKIADPEFWRRVNHPGIFERAADAVRKAEREGILIPLTLSAATKEYAADLRREYGKQLSQGGGLVGQQMTRYMDVMGMLEGAYYGPLGRAAPGTSALIGGLLPGGLQQGGELSRKQYEFGLVYEYEKLRRQVSDRDGGLTPALQRGTQEAQRVINMNQMKAVSLQEEIRNTLMRAEMLEGAQAEYQRQLVDALLEILREREKEAQERAVAPMPRLAQGDIDGG